MRTRTRAHDDNEPSTVLALIGAFFRTLAIIAAIIGSIGFSMWLITTSSFVCIRDGKTNTCHVELVPSWKLN